MPIFEFKCLECEEFFEVLFMSGDNEQEIKCSKCESFSIERVVSATNYAMGGSAASKNQSLEKQTRQCSSGSCTTYTVPGETRG
ncbi:MAG: zinc ribbon domain-containing protein [Desulfamplus sp.]|nr:zinc ribbon domain-containing protein [Desulfamplus sp.]